MNIPFYGQFSVWNGARWILSNRIWQKILSKSMILLEHFPPWPTTPTANAALTHSQWSRQTRLAKDFESKWGGGIASQHHLFLCFSLNCNIRGLHAISSSKYIVCDFECLRKANNLVTLKKMTQLKGFAKDCINETIIQQANFICQWILLMRLIYIHWFQTWTRIPCIDTKHNQKRQKSTYKSQVKL